MMRGLCAVMAVALVVAYAHGASTCDSGVEQRPGYHVMPKSDWCNDPNGPVYYNGVYHLFFQFNPTAPVWGDMHWGHAVSKDLAHWQHLPAALSPDMPYDKNGVFTGSITIVDGKPVASYTCVGEKQLQCLAYPANTSDPLLEKWVKPASNPIIAKDPAGDVGGNFRDPTTAWQTTVDGKAVWAMMVGASIDTDGVTNGSATVYTSPDFRTWSFHNIMWANHEQGSMWECPDFFALGTAHVLKRSADGQDWYNIGTYDETDQTFAPTSATTLYTYGQWYASKRFHDPVKNRQILWGWVAEEDGCGRTRGWASLQSLPRVLTIDPTFNILLANPIEELQLLRGTHLVSKTNIGVSSTPTVLTNPASPAGQQLEIMAKFSRPAPQSSPWSLGLSVVASADLAVRTDVVVSFQPAQGPWNNTDLPGGDYRDFSLPENVPDAANVKTCQSACEAELRCMAWTYVRKGDPVVPRCSLKASIPAANPNNHYCVSGIVERYAVNTNRTLSSGDGPSTAQGGVLPVAASDDAITLHVFVDHSVIETFAQGGRARITSRVYPDTSAGNAVAAFASPSLHSDVSLLSIDVWTVNNAFST